MMGRTIAAAIGALYCLTPSAGAVPVTGLRAVPEGDVVWVHYRVQVPDDACQRVGVQLEVLALPPVTPYPWRVARSSNGVRVCPGGVPVTARWDASAVRRGPYQACAIATGQSNGLRSRHRACARFRLG